MNGKPLYNFYLLLHDSSAHRLFRWEMMMMKMCSCDNHKSCCSVYLLTKI